MRSVEILLLCVLAAVAYGVVHDQVTARVCVEYFTIGHPPLLATDDPTWLGIGWGIAATWWVGFLLGLPLCVAARAGPRPKQNARLLIGPLGVLMGIVGVVALLAGLAGWMLARGGMLFVVGPLAAKIPADRHALFLADLWAHLASYLGGFVGGMVLIVLVWRRRGRVATESKHAEETT